MKRKYILLTLLSWILLMIVSMSAYALDIVNGVYQISTATDWKKFAALVNDGNVYACAELTADINLGTNVTMIGTADVNGQRYDGTFNGKGHTIKFNMTTTEANAALFRYIGWCGIIQNLKVQGTIATNNSFAAGLVARGRGVVRDCYIDVNIISSKEGDATHGGVVAIGFSGTIVENTLAKIAIIGEKTQNCGGVVGWAETPCNIVNCLVVSDGSTIDISNGNSRNIARNDSRVLAVDVETYNQDIYSNRPGGACYNNYVTNDWGGNNPATTVVPLKDLADGCICYQLNNDQSRIAWVQTIGTDPFPVPSAFGTGQVYASGATDCKGTSTGNLTYSNTPSNAITTAHTFDKYGICSACGTFNFHYFEFDDSEKFDQTDRAVFLRSVEDIDVAEGMNRICNGFKLNMKMANDIEYIAEEGKYIFNASDWIDGNFNGDGHELTIELTNPGNYASFMPEMAGNFENVVMHGTIKTQNQYAGSVSGDARMALVRNVYSDIVINSSLNGDNTSGGFFGMMRNDKRVENCIYGGSITVPENSSCARVGGFSGWAHAQTYFTNCAVLGNIIGAGNQSLQTSIENSGNISRNWSNIVCENVYVVNPIEGNDVSDHDKYTHYDNKAGIANGELAFFLNGNQSAVERFYQKIGEDLFPLPIKKEDALIYSIAESYRCDGLPLGEITYSNTPNSTTLPPHQFVDGFCSVCDGLQEDFLTPVDGWFEISNGAALVWWTNYASKNLGVNARLTADIDMEGYCDRWANVGTEDAPFYGNFDGQFHTISNLIVVKPQSRGVGLIAVMNSLPSAGYGGISDADARATKGVYIKDVVLDESCFLLGYGYIGLVGMTAPWAGHVNIRGVMMCGNVTANGGPNASGVFGCVMNSTCHVTIDNCGMVGNVYGPKENGSFSGWLGSYAEVTNCFAVGSVEGIESDEHYFARYGSDNVKFTNCYAKYGTQVLTVSDDDLTSGALAYGLNGNQGGVERFYQKIGEDLFPMPIKKEGALVYEIKHLHCNGDVYEHPVFSNENNIIMDKHNFIDGICSYCGFSEKDDINFADANVKAICVSNWDTDGDGWLSYDEAAAITGLGEAFKKNTAIKTFNELQYFISLQSIDNSAFFGCNSLTSFIIPQSVTSIGNFAFGNCRSLTSVTIPNSVTTIGNSAFANCSNMPSFTISDSVTSIGKSAFSGCRSLTTITIPENVMSIGEGSFNSCSGMTCVTSFIEEPFACSAFDNDTYNNATLYVPFGTIDLYRSTDDWKNFNSIEEMPQKKTNLVLWAKDGSTVAFALSKKPKITFTETDLQIAGESIDVTYSLDNLAQFTYETDDYVTAIKDIKTEEVSFNLSGESLLFPALKANSTVFVYTLNGMLVFKKTVSQDGEYAFPLSNLNAGVYMINVNGLTYKIMKK